MQVSRPAPGTAAGAGGTCHTDMNAVLSCGIRAMGRWT
jgi:hypothetical protein